MKMRFWQKSYFLTLAVFLICFNGGILSLTVYTHQKNLKATETAVEAEQYYAAMSFERDYDTLTKSNANASPTLLMQAFGTHYREKGLFLAFYKNGAEVFSNMPFSSRSESNKLLHTYVDGIRYIIIMTEICDGEYEFVIAKNVESLDTEMRSLMITYVIIGSCISIFLAVILFFLFRKLSKPLVTLQKTTEQIEAGDYSARVNEEGNDEFSLLAKSFNMMFTKINEQIKELEKEAAHRKIEAERKQMLVDNMAHELRTPLTSILGYAEYIEKAHTSEERRMAAARYIVSEGERLQKISEILLDGAFIRENKVEMEDVRIYTLLSQVKKRLEIKANEEGVDIENNAMPMIVQGNNTLLSILFDNLVENAIKACAKGGEIQLSCSDSRVIVEDNGKGMTEEQLTHIAEPFYRTDKSRSRAEGGNGLGLALCKRIANAHGAELLFESKIGKGTRVIMTFTGQR